jgi:hypothetical protein
MLCIDGITAQILCQLKHGFAGGVNGRAGQTGSSESPRVQQIEASGRGCWQRAVPLTEHNCFRSSLTSPVKLYCLIKAIIFTQCCDTSEVYKNKFGKLIETLIHYHEFREHENKDIRNIQIKETIQQGLSRTVSINSKYNTCNLLTFIILNKQRIIILYLYIYIY